MSLLFAATPPDPTVALVLYGTMARFRRDVDYPHGIEDSLAPLHQIFDDRWGAGESLRLIGPSMRGDAQAREFLGRLEHAAGSPGIAFEDQGDHELKGVPGSWRLFAVSA